MQQRRKLGYEKKRKERSKEAKETQEEEQRLFPLNFEEDKKIDPEEGKR